MARVYRQVEKLIDKLKVHQLLELYRDKLGYEIDYISNWDMSNTNKNDYRVGMLLASYNNLDIQELYEIASELCLDPPESFELNDAGITFLQPINLVPENKSIYKVVKFNNN